MEIRGRLLATLVRCTLAMLSVPVHADILVVVQPDSPLRELTRHQVSDLYLGRSRNPIGSESVLVIEHERDSDLRARFFRQLNGMSLKQINAYWARLQFSGQVLPPPNFRNLKDLLEAIRSNPMAIGYIDSANADGSVRVVLRLQDPS